MAQQHLNVGTTANDGTGDSLRVSQQKAESNFNELYARPDFTDAPSDGNLYGRKDATWEQITGGSGTTPTLQEVTDEGNYSPLDIQIDYGNGALLKFVDGQDNILSSVAGNGGLFIFNDESTGNAFTTESTELSSGDKILATREWTTAQIPTTATELDALKRDGSNANSDVDLGNFRLKAGELVTQTLGSTKLMALKGNNLDGEYTAEWQPKNYDGVADMSDVNLKQDILTSDNFGTFSNGLSSKTTPINADTFNISDSADTNKAKKLSFTNLKTFLKTYFDGLYQSTLGYTAEDTANKSTNVNTDQASNTKYPSVKSVYDWAVGLFATKSMSAYSFRVNNTNATANSTETNYRSSGKQTYSGAITFTGTTAPSGATNHSYNFIQIGNLVTLNITLNYATNGTSITAVQLELPSGCPVPVQPNGLTSALDRLYTGIGNLGTNSTTYTPILAMCVIRNNSGNTAQELYIQQASNVSRYVTITIQYFTA